MSTYEWLLFLHLLAAFLLVSGLVTEALSGLAFRTLLVGVLPAYILMRVGAEWIDSEEGVPDDVDWIGIGYAVADGGLLLTIIATVLAWRAKRRGAAGPGGLGRGVLGLAAVLLLAYAVAIWAMTVRSRPGPPARRDPPSSACRRPRDHAGRGLRAHDLRRKPSSRDRPRHRILLP